MVGEWLAIGTGAFAFLCMLIGFLKIVGWLVGGKKAETVAPPPTERQLRYIEILFDERNVPSDIWEMDEPKTIDEASELISKLKECHCSATRLVQSCDILRAVSRCSNAGAAFCRYTVSCAK